MVTPSLHWIDIAIIVGYLSAMLGMGVYFMRRQKDTSEYLLASRSVGWFAIGLSLLSSLNSAMDYVVGPASYMEWGLILSVSMISIVLAFPIVLRTFIPFYQRLRIYNCYEYLEYRFNVWVRVTVSMIFLLWRICWMSFTIYLPAYVLNVVVASNLFGDILSDLGGAISGSLGLAPSANINPDRRFPSLFEPVHGSALDIAGKQIANPIGAIRSAVMMLDFLGEQEAARMIENAVSNSLTANCTMTADLGGSSTTSAVGDDIARRIEGDE